MVALVRMIASPRVCGSSPPDAGRGGLLIDELCLLGRSPGREMLPKHLKRFVTMDQNTSIQIKTIKSIISQGGEVSSEKSDGG